MASEKRSKKSTKVGLVSIIALALLYSLVYDDGQKSDKLQVPYFNHSLLSSSFKYEMTQTIDESEQLHWWNRNWKWTGAWPSLAELPRSQRRDTACPITPVRLDRVKRWPDIIGVGAPKCGTGALAFFDCHTKIRFRESEGRMWTTKRWHGGLGAYAVPMAAPDEILIEKTPETMNGDYLTLLGRAQLIKQHVPQARLLCKSESISQCNYVTFSVVLCDPIKRLISHEKHLVSWSVDSSSKRQRSDRAAWIDRVTIGNTRQHVKQWFNSSTGSLSVELPKQASRLLRYGNYATQLKPFIEVFGIENVIILDGANMGNSEAQYFESRLNLEHELQFEFNEQKHFNCLRQPVQYCLSDAKGRPSTTNKTAALEPESKILFKYFQPEMREFAKLLIENNQLAASICTDAATRFLWLVKYIC